MIDDLLKILDAALELDFEPANPEADDGHILPQTVLKILVERFNADGGNFSIYDAPTGTLDVRAHHVTYSPITNFMQFRKKMAEIGLDNDKRRLSTSYRCLDQQAPLIVTKSSNLNVNKSTLDLNSLLPAENQSAMAVPLKFHGQVIGVINMDINNAVEKIFDKNDFAFLQTVSRILSPSVYNSIFIEAMSAITGIILDQRDGNRDNKFNGVCQEISKALFTPWVGIYKKHANLPEFNLIGKTDHHVTGDLLSSNFRKIRIHGGNPQRIGVSGRVDLSKSNGPFSARQISEDCPEQAAGMRFHAYPLSDKEGHVFGLFLFLSAHEHLSNQAFKNVANFVAKFTSAAFGALSAFEDQAEKTYEVAAHEFVRNLNALSNTISRMRSFVNPYVRQDRIMPITDQKMSIDRSVIRQMSVVMSVLDSNVGFASNTVAHILDDERYDHYRSRLPAQGNQANFPSLMEARRRHARYKDDLHRKPVSIKRRIEDILNSYNKAMTERGIRWNRIYDQNIPNRVYLEPHNFDIILGNIVDNAVKYAKGGTDIRVQVDVDDLEIVLRVTNVGPHIDITRYEGADIFVKGVRGENGSEGFPGLGIGLWEADQIARLWGGGPLRLIHSEPLGIGGNWASICFELCVPLTA